VQIDGNDVLASYAVTRANLESARSGEGPRFIEALTYRMGAHTTSDDPTKYRDSEDVEFWSERDPIARFDTYLRARGEGDVFFREVATEAEDVAADARRRTVELVSPPAEKVFANVYSDPHPLVDAQRAWFAEYDASFEGAEA
jgi:pyruvate dehydrogenase E1 component alpha subunit